VIIVAGGGPYAGNGIAFQTRKLAEQAYMTAKFRGYSDANIMYLSAFDDPPPAGIVVDGASSLAALQSAILTWADTAKGLTIILLDHGMYDSGAVEWYFGMDETESGQRLAASVLDGWLDTAQSDDDPVESMILYVDACYAGGFVRKCSGAPGGRDRIVLASTTDARLANYGGITGRLSFTSFFLTEALLGNSLYHSYYRAYNHIATLRVPSDNPQLPWIDDNGDGRATSRDGTRASAFYFGAAGGFAPTQPTLVNARENLEILSAEDVDLWAELSVGDDANAVEAFIAYGQEIYPEALPITNHAVVALSREGSTQRWSGIMPATEILREGTYTVFYTARKNAGDATELQIEAEPLRRYIKVGEATLDPDEYEDEPFSDSTAAGSRNQLTPYVAQRHTIHSGDDEDWGRVFAILGDAELVISDYVVPNGANLSLWVWPGEEDEAPPFDTQPLAMLPLTSSDTGERRLEFLGGERTVFWQVRACDEDSEIGACIPISEMNAEFSYQISFEQQGAPDPTPVPSITPTPVTTTIVPTTVPPTTVPPTTIPPSTVPPSSPSPTPVPERWEVR
jgi:hypothetical protein